ncbi:MAG: LysE family translocator [Thiomonas sp.]|uniref:LysE family translocator n=1 Tax=Thiomonas sp. TaxID=2047785 RepID=UPI002A36F6D7|nr:LysE family translocator [Thiomonas sp.]MDY0329275.1 LysE family translocator [Thiomonas sp.]
MFDINLPALALFAFVTSVTPGPNNLMLLASGANFGFRASIPHLLGISTGVLILLASVGLGLAELFSLWPWAEVAMKWIGALYMIYLAWRIARASPPDGSAVRESRPMRYIGAFAFQWVNPKLWLMALSVFSVYVPGSGGFSLVLAVAALFSLINLPTISVWALGGARLRHLLTEQGRVKVFNLTMAALLLATLWPMLR